MATLPISCLTTSNLPWFMDLTFQVPMQYCSLHYQTLLPSAVTTTTGELFSLWLCLFIVSGVISPLFSSSILGEFIFWCHIFCLFLLFMGFSRQEYWSGLPFPPLGDHVLSELSTMTHPSWVALHSMAHVFIELDKAVVHVISLISFLWLWFSLSALWRITIRGLWKLPDGRDWLWGKLGAVLISRTMLIKSFIQFSVDGRGCVPSLLFDVRPKYGGGNEDNP